MFTEEELKWIRSVLDDKDLDGISRSYIQSRKRLKEITDNKPAIRLQLDELTNKLTITPTELLKLKHKKEREASNLDNFPGVYIIANKTTYRMYVGKATEVFTRVSKHFEGKGNGNPEVYNDYKSGHEFSISLIPLAETSFTSLNDLETAAFIAYELGSHDYNILKTNTNHGYAFKNDDYLNVAQLILDRVKDTEEFKEVQRVAKARAFYTMKLCNQFELPRNNHFQAEFPKMIQVYQKEIRSRKQ